MAAPIRVSGLDAEEADDLARALGARGIVGAPVGTGTRWRVEIRDAHEDTARLLAEVRATLETWLAEHGRQSVTVRVGSDLHTVDAAPSLAESLRQRVRGAAEQRPSR